jgi:FlaA1/EpsC-like NDP-sugar epimerase
VLGTLDEFPTIATRQRIESLLIPTYALPSLKIRSLISTCNDKGIKAQIVPRYEALLSGKLTIGPRDLDIEDLLHRDPVQLDGESIGRLLRGRVILVTGAAGSIGSELCRQALRFHPARLILLDHSENGLFHLSRELLPLASDTEVIPLIASITDVPRIRSAFGQFRPDVILHAAAHKHVPLMEDSPGEAIKNNVFGTRTVVDEAVRSGVEAFVMISTDKAVHPTSVMGACKRLAEMYVQSCPEPCTTRLVTVRFGNVLGSNGSVVPLFQEQIRRGEPVTVTHPEMTRYFMTIPEAAQLVLQAGALGRGGEIFVLDMGEPVKILDLATDLIHLSGHSEEEVEIVFTGLRPGEKLFEELYDPNEIRLRTPHPKIFRAQHRHCDPARLRAQLDGLAALVNSPADEICDALRAIVPEYQGRHPAKEPCPAKGTRQAVARPIGRATVSSREGRVPRDPLSREKNQGPEGRAAVGPREVLCASS